MIKFEVGKVYKRLDSKDNTFKVISRTPKGVVICFDFLGTGKDFSDTEYLCKIEIYGDVEVLEGWSTVNNNLMGRADEEFNVEAEKDEEPEANIEEVKEEDKEEEVQEDSDDWIIEDEYEAICLETKQRFGVKLADIDENSSYALMFISKIYSLVLSDWFEDYKDVAIANNCGKNRDKTVVVFKHGIESVLGYEEIKEERKPVCFEVGKEYKACSRDSDIWELKAVFDANDGKISIFYNKRTNVFLRPVIKTLNSVEYTTYGNVPDELDFIADEKYAHEIKALL